MNKIQNYQFTTIHKIEKKLDSRYKAASLRDCVIYSKLTNSHLSFKHGETYAAKEVVLYYNDLRDFLRLVE